MGLQYHFAVVETDTSFYPSVRGADGTILYAVRGKDGKYLPTNVPVGSIEHPDLEPTLKDSLHEQKHVVRAECIEQDFCRWKLQQTIKQQQSQSKPSVTSGTVANLVIPFQFADHLSRDILPIE